LQAIKAGALYAITVFSIGFAMFPVIQVWRR
jgi:hypothetical protein